jgi:hypothetical protein
MEVYVIYELMRNPSIVLQYVVVLDVLCNGNALCNGEDFGKLVVGYIVELRAVMFGDDQLARTLVLGLLVLKIVNNVQSGLCSMDRCQGKQVSFRSQRSSSKGSRLSLLLAIVD